MQFKPKIEQILARNLSEMGFQFENLRIEHPAQEEHGDYSTNVAMVLWGQHTTDAATPFDLAQQIVKKLQNDIQVDSLIEGIEAVKPGFINFKLSKIALEEELKEILQKGQDYGKYPNQKKTMVLDHSHPNIAKRFGIGHLRSTIIGQALIKIYRFYGYNVIADNFLGDWGTQFGSLIAAIKQKNLNPEDLSIDELEELYVEFNKQAKDDPQLWEDAKYWFKELENGNKDARSIWESVKKTSMEEFEKIWKLLDVEFDYIHGESFFEDKMAQVIEDAKEKGVAKEDQGALIVRVPGIEAPLLLLKSDGATTYETRDLAAIRFWVQEFSPDIIAYEVGSEQALHFEHVFTVAQMLGYITKDKLIHIQHGLYLGEDGKKMRTRTGKTIKLEDVLEEAVKKARKLVKNKELKEKEKDDVARAVGLGAIKYFDLSHHHTSDIVFSWDKVFQLEGNSAPYLQYTNARINSLIERANFQFSFSNIQLENEEEEALLRHIYKFSEVIEDAAKNYSPNLVCNFLFELAQRFNAFYAKHRILEAEGQEKDFRLALTSATGIILKTGLELLGIQTPERM